MSDLKPKEPLLAIIFSLIFVGLGQIYAGRWRRGILLIGISALLGVFGLSIFYFIVQPNTGISLTLLIIATILLLISMIFGIFVIIDAYRCAKAFNVSNNLERKITFGKKIFLILGIIFVLLIPGIDRPIAMYIRENYVQVFRFPSGSMKPTIVEGDRLIADKTIYKKSKPKKGDLIVFRYPQDPKRDFLKRLIAVGGETVEIKQGDIFINGQLINDPKIKRFFYYNRGEYGQKDQAVKVPEGHYYVLGDNSVSSYDSRYWGFVPEENVTGKVYKIYWPLNRAGPIK